MKHVCLLSPSISTKLGISPKSFIIVYDIFCRKCHDSLVGHLCRKTRRRYALKKKMFSDSTSMMTHEVSQKTFLDQKVYQSVQSSRILT